MGPSDSTSTQLPPTGRPEAAAVVWPRRTPGPEERADRRRALARAARRGGVVRAVIAASVGVLLFFFWHRYAAYLVWGITALLLLIALLSPLGWNRRLEAALARFGHLVGRVLTVVLLTPLFYTFFTLFGLLLRRGRRDRLDRRFEPAAESYWQPHRERPREPATYERLF